MKDLSDLMVPNGPHAVTFVAPAATTITSVCGVPVEFPPLKQGETLRISITEDTAATILPGLTIEWFEH